MKTIFLSIMLMICVSGCHLPSLFRGRSKAPPKPLTAGEQLIGKTIHSTDYLMTALIVAAVLGFITGFHGFKSGFIIALCSILGAAMKAALSVTWVYYVSAVIFVMAIVVAAIAMLSKKKEFKDKDTALSNLVGDIEKMKGLVKKNIPSENLSFLHEQQDPTKKVVAQIRGKQSPFPLSRVKKFLGI